VIRRSGYSRAWRKYSFNLRFFAVLC